jgi:hypothetical protein
MLNKQSEKKVFIVILFSVLIGIYCGGCTSGDNPVDNPHHSSPEIIPKYKTFVTAATFSGDIASAGGQATGIASADALCMADANKPADSSAYKAILIDGTNRVACTTSLCSGGTSEHIDWVLQPNAEYYRSDGTTLILKTNANGIFDFGANLTNSFDTTNSTYWTGLSSDWTDSNANIRCLGWTYGVFGPTLGGYGMGDQTNYSSIAGSTGYDFCDAIRNLVCVEQ